MLINFRFRNFQSFRDWAEIDFQQNGKVPVTDWWATSDTDLRVAKVMTVLGHNASGKTAMLKAVVFLHWFMANSFDQLKPDAPISLSPHFSSADEPSEFELLFEFDKQLWRYELRCTPQRVLHEALYRRKERFGYVFVREWDAASETYHVKQQEFGFAAHEATKAANQRQNASMISIAAQHGVPLAAALFASINRLQSNINQLGKEHLSLNALFEAAEYFANDFVQRSKMQQLLKSLDLGLFDIEFEQITVNMADGSTARKWMPMGIHNGKDSHKYSEAFKLSFFQESSGTQGALVLLSRLLPVLWTGGIAVIDEFENDLHPHMLEPILDLFASPSKNPHNAQILFTCHAAEVLNVLPKSQVMLVEKDEYCESSTWRLDEMQSVRSDDNYYGKYMAGAYGAVPNL